MFISIMQQYSIFFDTPTINLVPLDCFMEEGYAVRQGSFGELCDNIFFGYPRSLHVSRTSFFTDCLGVVFLRTLHLREWTTREIEDNSGLCLVLTCIQTP